MDLFDSLDDIEIGMPTLAESKPEESVAISPAETPAPVAGIMPPGFDIRTLLTFLPDVRLKQELNEIAEHAQQIDLKSERGLVEADEAVARLRDKIAEIKKCFDLPVDLANQLHKRLTGLRADFLDKGSGVERQLTSGILTETRRRDAEAEAERQRLQEEADAKAKAEAEAAVQEAEEEGVDPEVVEELKREAKTAQAQLIPFAKPSAALTQSSKSDKWKARPVGTRDGMDPNPKMVDLTPEQTASIRQLMKACASGKLPLTYFEIRWPPLNDIAKNQRTAMKVPGIVAFNEGSLRRKR